MVFVYDPYEDGTEESTEHLGDDIGDDISPGEHAGAGQTEGYSGVEVSSGVVGDEHARHDGETPGEGDDDPSATFSFTLV